MRIGRAIFLSTVLAASGWCGSAQAEILPLLWDNYATGYNPNYYWSSERDSVVNDSWVVDDAVFDGNVEIQGIDWVGLYNPSFSYTAEFTVLQYIGGASVFETVVATTEVPVSIENLGTVVNGFQLFRGTIDVTDFALPFNAATGGQYFFGTRLVSQGNPAAGRSFIVNSTYGADIRGLSGAYAHGAQTTGTGGWLPFQQIAGWNIAADFAFRVYGVPEPSGLILIGLGALSALLRRR